MSRDLQKITQTIYSKNELKIDCDQEKHPAIVVGSILDLTVIPFMQMDCDGSAMLSDELLMSCLLIGEVVTKY